MKNITKHEPDKFQVGKYIVTDDGNIYRIDEILEDGNLKVKQLYLGKWQNYGHMTVSYLHTHVLTDSLEEIEKIAKEVQADPHSFAASEEVIDTETTALAKAQSAETITAMQNVLKEKKRKVFITRAYMESKRKELANIISGLQEKIGKLQMILDAIELYLGIGSEIKILREGAPVDDNDPKYYQVALDRIEKEMSQTKPTCTLPLDA